MRAVWTTALSLVAIVGTAVLCSADDAPQPPYYGFPQAAVSEFLADPVHNVIELTDATFHDTVIAGQDEEPSDFLVFFYAPWCGHCKATKPIFAAAADALRTSSVQEAATHFSLKDKPRRFSARLAMIDATANTAVAKAYGVRSYPTFFHFGAGKAYKYTGGRDQDSFAFFARFAGFARHHSPLVPSIATGAAILEVQRLAATRVLFLLSNECATEKGEATSRLPKLRTVCADLALSFAGNNNVHFAMLGAPVEEVFAADKAKSPAQAEKFKRIVEGFSKTNPGDQGERLVALSDLYEFDGVVPYTGDWRLSPTVRKPAVGDDAAGELTSKLWGPSVPALPAKALTFVKEFGSLPVGDADPGSLQSSFEKAKGKGLIGLVMAGTSAEEQRSRELLTGLAQERNKQLRAAEEAVAAAKVSRVEGTAVEVDDEADEQAASTPASEEADRKAGPFLTSRKTISLHAVTPAQPFADEFAVSLGDLPVFSVYWPKHQMICNTRLNADALAEKPSRDAVEKATAAARAAMERADNGDFSGCVGRDWPATIVFNLVTRPLPSLDGPLRDFGLGNVELVMVGGCGLLMLALIPLALLRKEEDPEEMKRRYEAYIADQKRARAAQQQGNAGGAGARRGVTQSAAGAAALAALQK